MAQKWVDLSNTTSGSRIQGVEHARLQLSDGTDVWIEYDPSVATAYLRYSPDHQTVNALATLSNFLVGDTSYTDSTALARDASDNLYVVGADATNPEYARAQAFVKTPGSYTWTAQTQGTWQTGGEVLPVSSAWWMDTTGGTNGAGHVGFSSMTLATYILDAGALLEGIVSVVATEGYVGGWASPDGFGAVSGIMVYNLSGSSGGRVLSFSVSTSGAMTSSQIGSFSEGPAAFPVRYGSGQWAIVVPTSGAATWTIFQATTTSIGTGIVSGSFTQVSSSGQWAAFADPNGNQVWVLAAGAVSSGDVQMYRLAWTPGGWATSLVTDDLLTSITSVTALRSLVQPVVSAVAWDFSIETTSSDYALYGDFTLFGSPPSAPTLLGPANSAYMDVSSGASFSATYNSTDQSNQNAYAFHIKTSGASSYSYYNASTNALQSTEVWNTDSVAPSATFGITLPAGAISDGNTYNWSFASQESIENLQGPFATDFTFTAQGGPNLSVEGPTGTVANTAQPVVTWTATPGTGAVLTAYRVVIYTTAQTEVSGFTPGTSPSTWDSGTIAGTALSLQVGIPLTNSQSYYAFVQVTETGGVTSNWGFVTFTMAFDAPATPSISAVATTDPTTGCPMVQLSVQAADNLLTLNQASLEQGTTTGWTAGTNTTISATQAEAEDGTWSMLLTPAAAGAVSASTPTGTSGVPVSASEITAMASFLAGTTSRSCEVAVTFYNSSGTSLGTATGTVSDAVGSWTRALVSAAVPAGTVYASVEVSVSSVSGSTDVHYVDEVGLFPGTTSTWSAGGFVGTTSVQIIRSDGQQVRGASISNPAAVPSPGQLVVVNDYEVFTNIAYTYMATVVQQSSARSSTPAVSQSVTVTSDLWWSLNPLDPPSAVAAQPVQWNPVNTEQSTAHPVMGQITMNMIANTMMSQDFNATFELFTASDYEAFQDLLRSQMTIFLSSPWGHTDSGWFRIGPQTGGMSSGVGNKVKDTQLLPSTASGPHRTVAVTAVAQPRPAV